MKVLISVDIEGISGIANNREETTEQAKRWMTADTNAAVRGAIEGGAKKITVVDSHGKDNENILLDELHSEARIIRGGKNTPLYFLEGLDKSCTAVFLVGWHDKIGGPGVLAHTFVSKQLTAIKINGQAVGEGQIAAGVAGYFGVPIVLITGDNVVCQEIKSFLGDVEIAVVKKAIDRYAANCLPLKKARNLIKNAAKRALQRVKDFHPFVFSSPTTLEFDCADYNIATILARIPSVEFIKPLTVRYRSSDFMNIFNMLIVWRCLLKTATEPN